MQVGSGGAARAWIVLNFVLLKLFDITILALTIALKRQSKAFTLLAGGPLQTRPSQPSPLLPSKEIEKTNKKITVLLKLINTEGKKDCTKVDPQLSPFSIFFCIGLKWMLLH